MSEHSEDDIGSVEEEFADPISQYDRDLIEQFKLLIQKTKANVYNLTVGKQKETGDNTNLDGLNEYETQMNSIGTNLLQAALGTEEGEVRRKTTPISLWNLIQTDLSPDALILIENEIRTQFIQHPFVRTSSKNVE